LENGDEMPLGDLAPLITCGPRQASLDVAEGMNAFIGDWKAQRRL
jgi:hypothetical protein